MKTDIQKIKIQAGETFVTYDKRFDAGYNVIGCAFVRQKGDADNNVEIVIKDSQGSVYVPKMSLKWLEKGENGFKTNEFFRLPPSIQSNIGVNLEISTAAMTNDFEGEILFLLEKGAVLDANGKVIPEEEHKEQFCKRQ